MTDGDGGTSNTASQTVALNTPSVVTTSAGTTAFTEDGGAVVIDNALTVTDTDNPDPESATVTITNPQAAAQWLIGQGATGVNFDALMGIVPPAGMIARPGIGGTRPTIQGTLTLNGNNVRAQGFNLSNAASTGINDAAGAVSGVSVSEVSVTSTTGTAVNLSDLGGTLSLTSVSSNGGVNGIVLTDTTGSFTVNGTGGSCNTADPACSGGQITGKTGDGIQLTNTQNVSLTRMRIDNNNDSGIRGSNVTNLTLNTVLIEENTDNTVGPEAGLSFSDLLGTVLLDNTTVRRSHEHNIEILSSTGTLSSLMIQNRTIEDANTPNQGADDLFIEASGTHAVTVVVQNSTFDDNLSDAIQVDTLGSSNVDITISGNNFSNGARAVTLAAGNSSTLTFDILNNPLITNFSPNLGEEAINVTALSFITGSSLLEGTIMGNNNVTQTGGLVGVDTRGSGKVTLLIDGNMANTSRQALDNLNGDTGGTTNNGDVDITITNNTVTVAGLPGSPNNEGIVVEEISDPGDGLDVCVNIRGNTSSASGTREDIALLDLESVINIESGPMDCGGAACANAEAHLLANNTLTTVFADSTVGLVAIDTCDTP